MPVSGFGETRPALKRWASLRSTHRAACAGDVTRRGRMGKMIEHPVSLNLATKGE